MFDIELDEKTVEKLEDRIDELNEELKPRKGFYEVDPLYHSFEMRLENYSFKANGKIDPEIVDSAKKDLEESLTPATLEATSGIDEILSYIYSIELASVIVENERDKIESLSDENYTVNVGRIGLTLAMSYLFNPDTEPGRTRFNEIFDKVKVYIPQYQKSNKGAGCMVLLLGLTGLTSFYLLL